MKIEVLKGLGYSCRYLNRSHTTISRELKRLEEWSAEKAQWHATAQKKKCGVRSKFIDKLRKVIKEKLKTSHDASGASPKRKRQLPRETRGRFNVGTSIQQCPKEVKTREIFGHVNKKRHS